jgi:hypothetical protein
MRRCDRHAGLPPQQRPLLLLERLRGKVLGHGDGVRAHEARECAHALREREALANAAPGAARERENCDKEKRISLRDMGDGGETDRHRAASGTPPCR